MTRTGYRFNGWRNGNLLVPAGTTWTGLRGHFYFTAEWVRRLPIEVSVNHWEPRYRANAVFITVDTIQPHWHIGSVSEPWLGTEMVEGGLILTVPENPGANARTARVIITSGGLAHTINVTQAGRPLIRMEYRLMTNDSGGTALVFRAQRYLADIAPGFRNTLGIDLVRTQNLLSHLLNAENGRLCGTREHRYVGDFLRVGAINNVNTFRFVDFRLCGHLGSNPHDGIGGRAVLDGNDMIADIRHAEPWATFHNRMITSHEITHLLGARDHLYERTINDPNARPCVPNSNCVMMGLSYDTWCDVCIREILALRASRR